MNRHQESQSGEHILRRFKTLQILVLGDVMLDEYVYGTVGRVSPEAPVPVLERTSTVHIPGGAANVAVNIASLGGTPVLVGVVGQDSHAGDLEVALQKRGVGTDHLVVERDRPTTTKTRIVASRHQIVRVDEESRVPVAGEQMKVLREKVERCMEAADGCVLSDYGKGVLSTSLCELAIERATASGKPVIVDPKTKDLSKYRDATVITPNLREFCLAAGEQVCNDAGLHPAAERIFDQIGKAALLVTKGERGMTLVESRKAPLHAQALARQVFDVTGAGDTVVSTLALALAAGAGLADAAFLANIAAGLVVVKPGTAWVSLEELSEAVKHQRLDQWRTDGAPDDYAAFDS